jgi:hypothetical protein
VSVGVFREVWTAAVRSGLRKTVAAASERGVYAASTPALLSASKWAEVRVPSRLQIILSRCKTAGACAARPCRLVKSRIASLWLSVVSFRHGCQNNRQAPSGSPNGNIQNQIVDCED